MFKLGVRYLYFSSFGENVESTLYFKEKNGNQNSERKLFTIINFNYSFIIL